MITTLTRTVRFSAGHRYGRADWPPERNQQAFGANTHPHGHNYEVAVTVAGELDPDTGFLIDLAALDGLLERHVRQPLDQRDLNREIEAFRTGRTQPSTEALAHHFWSLFVERIPAPARLDRIVVRESDSLEAEVRAG